MKARTLILAVAALALFAVPTALAAGPDATTVIRYLAPKAGKYQIELENTSSIGYIDAFAWIPPAGLTVTAVTRTAGGRCRLTESEIDCTGAGRGIAPPICICRAGGFMTVTFTATGYSPKFNGQYWTYYGIGAVTNITQVTPVGHPIPSTMPQVQLADLPICPLGTQPDPVNPTCSIE
jgi:hypothetical protein